MMRSTPLKHLSADERGSVLVEVTLLIPLLMIFLLGAVDFLNAFTQWNLAVKAVEVGARIAAVSDPVASGLNSIPTNILSSSVTLGANMPDFQVTCDGAAASCTCTRGTCTGMGSYSSTAMNAIVYGRTGGTGCHDAASYYQTGMCDILPSIKPANVRIIYTQTGLGYAGRTSGPVPTISLSLHNIPFHYFFLGDLLGIAVKNLPPLTTTITGEALSSAAH